MTTHIQNTSEALHEPRGLAGRVAILVYGVACYAVFFATFLYAIGFMGGFGMANTLDAQATTSTWMAIAIDLGLLALFAVQHSVMARPAFKRWWTQYVPEAAERSTYVLLSSAALIALFAFWEPLGGSIWSVENTAGVAAIYTGYGFGWVLVFVSTFLINHFDLFGLRQVWLAFQNKPYTELKFVTPWPYRVIRHPLYLGWLFAIWCTPEMTAAHLLFAVMTTAYIFVGIRLEERDLIDAHPDYKDYQDAVPMIVPGIKKD